LRHAIFTKKADVFAAGVLFLELITLCSPGRLYEILKLEEKKKNIDFGIHAFYNNFILLIRPISPPWK
jgi:hypothetical protein